MSIFYKISVKEVKRETPNAVSVEFDIPKNLISQFNFIPGQYITIQKELKGEVLRRAYSICSPCNSDELRVAIKEVDQGKFSVYANSDLKAGDYLEITVPEGKFILETKPVNKKSYLAFVAGSGITPVFSMIKSVLEIEKESKFTLVYGNKSKEEAIFKSELDQFAIDFKNRFTVYYVYSKEKNDNAYSGRINADIVYDVLKNKQDQINFDKYFICGPEEMIDSVKESLSGHNVDKDLIKFELFTSSTKKKEINTDLSGNTLITVVLDEEETTYQMSQKELILNATLAQGLDAPYSCQGGVCSSCLARVTEGSAEMEKNTILNDVEVEEGLILTCQAHPTTPTIKIDYDDV
ncbi:MAG: ferredoxin--NADP reductase [Flavobacteriaceae bacterium]|nr:ferredoxin--NADP reductase [Flavobacteriaceae bacterium]